MLIYRKITFGNSEKFVEILEMKNVRVSHLLRRISIVQLQIEDRLDVLLHDLTPEQEVFVVNQLLAAREELAKVRELLPLPADRTLQ